MSKITVLIIFFIELLHLNIKFNFNYPKIPFSHEKKTSVTGEYYGFGSFKCMGFVINRELLPVHLLSEIEIMKQKAIALHL